MGRQSLEYPTDARNKVNRLGKNRGRYDLSTIHSILNSSLVVHVSFTPAAEDPFPVILPMIGVMGSFSNPSAGPDEPQDCYLHGYVSSRLMNLARKSDSNNNDNDNDANGESPSSTPNTGLAVCIAATKVDGLVLSLTPNSHSYNYRSAVLFGHAHLVTAADEKLWAMQRITNRVVAGRWANTRVPPNGGEMASTQILRVEIVSGSAKVRDGPPADESVDVEDAEVTAKVWTGFVPLVEQLGEPVPSLYNRVADVPDHVTEYRESFNGERNEYVRKVVANVKGTEAMYGQV